MRVLHVYSGNLYGGIETLLATIARHADSVPDLHHEFGLCFQGRLWNELTAAGAELHDLAPVRFGRPWTVLRARRRLTAILRDCKIDAVVTHACWPHVVFGPTVRRFPGVRLVNWAHDILRGTHWIEKLAKTTPPDSVIANSLLTAESVANVFPSSPVTIVHCPVEAHAIEGDRNILRTRLGAGPNATVILIAARMEAWKGHARLLEALGGLRDIADWELWVAGGAQRPHELAYRQQLESQAGDLDIQSRVKFLGQRSDVGELMAASDLFCQPNVEPEPFGIVYVEALYAGLPVVATNSGGASEIVDESCGILTPPEQIAPLAEALKSLILDSARRIQLGAAAPRRAAELCDPVSQLHKFKASLVDTPLACGVEVAEPPIAQRVGSR